MKELFWYTTHMDRMAFDTPIGEVWGVGEQYVKKLEKLNIRTVRDLVYHKPSRYEDWSMISPTTAVQAGEKVTVVGKIVSITPVRTKYGKQMQIARLMDEGGEIQLVWFNQRYLLAAIQVGSWYSVSGKADVFNGQLSLMSPEFENLRTPPYPYSKKGGKLYTIHTGRLVPVYPETYGVSSKWLRSRIKVVLEQALPTEDWIEQYKNSGAQVLQELQNFLDIATALYQIHFPDSMEMAEKAQKRLARDELLVLHLENLARRADWKNNKVAVKVSVQKSVVKSFISSLPFKLTRAQERAVDEILIDLGKDKPMNRLLEGDVGSGKTVVAAAAALAAVNSGVQVAVMAPTEILAQQHFETLRELLKSCEGFNIVLQTGRKKFVKKGKDEPFDVIVGTHALLSDVVNFDNLGLVIIDEQHRFGVEQRAKLVNKPPGDFSRNRSSHVRNDISTAPHLLTMTATPIPRTVALTLYGDLDLSVLDEMPAGRKPVKTWLVPNHKRSGAYNWIREQITSFGTFIRLTGQKTEDRIQKTETNKIKTGNSKLETRNQVFVVCPFIEPSESMTTVKAARDEFEKLQKIFADFNLDLLHGRLKGKEKDEVIEKFRNGKTDILVSTPVVEVGVDIPQASIMLIEAAERFGLAQLHQLRGRVGRGGQQAYCLLFSESDSPQTKKRLKAMEDINSGLKLAELDMKMRGPGQIYGISQHGFMDLKFADYSDSELIQETKKLAEEVFPRLSEIPDLKKRLEAGIIREVAPN